MEDLGNRKYRVRMDGSGRLTDRNRQFLRQFKPATFSQPGLTTTASNNSEPALIGGGGEPDRGSDDGSVHSAPPSTPPTTAPPHQVPVNNDGGNIEVPAPPVTEVQPDTPPRRSTRGQRPQRRYNPEEWELYLGGMKLYMGGMKW